MRGETRAAVHVFRNGPGCASAHNDRMKQGALRKAEAAARARPRLAPGLQEGPKSKKGV